MQDTLGILVHSADYFNYVTKLARAALNKGKRVRIHLMQQGILYTREKAFDQLRRLTHITICSDSLAGVMHGAEISAMARHHLTPSRRLAEIMATCDRWVSF